MQPLYTAVKVNNEIELCEIDNLDCKKEIERELLRNHISYYIRWPKPSIFSRHKDSCIICINDNARDAAEEVVRNICEASGYSVKFLMKRSVNRFF